MVRMTPPIPVIDRHQLGSNIGGRASTRRRYCACADRRRNWTAATVESSGVIGVHQSYSPARHLHPPHLISFISNLTHRACVRAVRATCLHEVRHNFLLSHRPSYSSPSHSHHPASLSLSLSLSESGMLIKYPFI